MPLIPLGEKQKDYLKHSHASFNIAEGAISSGKTLVQILRWLAHCYRVPDDSLLLMSGKTNESLYDNVIRDMLRYQPIPGDIRKHVSPLRLSIRSKNIEIACADASNEKSWGRIQGKTVFGWLGDEVTQYPENFVKMAQGRCRGDGQIWPKFWTCNPATPRHFIKTDYINSTKLDVRTWHFELDDNPILSDEYKTELKASYTGLYYERYILGRWVVAEGAVYPEFGTHNVKSFEVPDEWQRVRAIDYGYTNPFVCLWGAVDEDKRLWIYDEHYQPKELIDGHVEQIKRRAGAFAWTVADWDAQENAELNAKGIPTRRAQKDVEIGLQKVKLRLIEQADGMPRIIIHPRCKHTIQELSEYQWTPQSRAGGNLKEEPLKEHDHTCDALRYMVMEIDHGGFILV